MFKPKIALPSSVNIIFAGSGLVDHPVNSYPAELERLSPHSPSVRPFSAENISHGINISSSLNQADCSGSG